MPISSHCFCPCDSEPATPSTSHSRQPDVHERSCDAVELLVRQRARRAAAHALVGLHREFQVLEHGHGLEHGRLLELAPDAGLRDLRLGERVRSMVWPKNAVPESGRVLPVITSIIVVLPAPLGPITQRSSPTSSVSDSFVQRLEAVEADGDVVQIQDRPVRGVDPPVDVSLRSLTAELLPRRSLRVHMRPARVPASQPAAGDRFVRCAGWVNLRVRSFASPTTLRQEQRHQHEEQAEEEEPVLGEATVKKLFAPLTSPHRSPAPVSVPRPPTATQIAISIELAGRHLARIDDADLRHVERARPRRTSPPPASR
jgi:hypothetical protein